MNNGNLKSLEELQSFLLQLLCSLFKDLLRMHKEKASDLERDLVTIRERLSSEGLGFITKTLPRLGKDIDFALQGRSPLQFPNFARSGRLALPAFLRGLLGDVFDKTTGWVLDNPSVLAISDLRQVCFLCYKLEVPYESSLVEACVNKFVSVDSSLPTHGGHLCSAQRRIIAVSRALCQGVVGSFDPLNIIPGHGPGEVATGEKPSEKFKFTRRYEALDELYNFEEYFLASFSHYADTAEGNVLHLQDVYRGEEYSCLAVVPKDSRGPRLIAMEPLEYMWLQQGIKKGLYDLIESHDLTQGHVNFTDQKINRDLALLASTQSSLVTLDMSDASDRVSMWLIEQLYEGTELLSALRATRSSRVKLPSGEFQVYKKFAPMGSALCFPIEALTFWALAVACMHVCLDVPILLARKLIWVYGDDIICRNELVESLFKHFPAFGLKFNEAKCCVSGRFRESCGMDAFAGEDVTPIRVKALPPRSRKDANSIVAYLDQSNLFWSRGYYSIANFLSNWVENIVGELPIVPLIPREIEALKKDIKKTKEFPVFKRRGIGFLALYSRVGYAETRRRRWSETYQRVAYKNLVPRPSYDRVDSGHEHWSELLRSLVCQGKEYPRVGVYPKRYTVALKSIWDDKPHPTVPGGVNSNFSMAGYRDPLYMSLWHSGCTAVEKSTETEITKQSLGRSL